MSDCLTSGSEEAQLKRQLQNYILDSKVSNPRAHEVFTLNPANQLTPNLKALDKQFKTQHFLIIDAIDESDEASLTRKQDILDNHNDNISGNNTTFASCSTTVDSGTRKTLFFSLTDSGTTFS